MVWISGRISTIPKGPLFAKVIIISWFEILLMCHIIDLPDYLLTRHWDDMIMVWHNFILYVLIWHIIYWHVIEMTWLCMVWHNFIWPITKCIDLPYYSIYWHVIEMTWLWSDIILIWHITILIWHIIVLTCYDWHNFDRTLLI